MNRMVLTTENNFNKCLESNSDPYIALLQYRNTAQTCGYSPLQLLMQGNLRMKFPVSEQI